MSRRRLALLLLACALVASTGLRVAAATEKRGLTHDESISLLAAACHQGDYARLTVAARAPFGRWVPASQWKALLRPDRPLCLVRIGRDLAREDIHPPLYFWLLHAWSLVVGVGLWTGLSLNIALAALTGLALFGLARRVLGDPLRAAAVTAVWSLSPAAIRVFAEARQYELLALLAVLFVWQCVRFADAATGSSRREAAGLALVTAAGALAQFLFALVAAAGAALLVVRLWSSRRAQLAWGLASIVAGYAIFSLLHPEFVLSLRRARGQVTEPALDLFAGRFDLTVRSVAEFVLPPALARGPVGYLACALLLGATAFAVLRGPRGSDRTCVRVMPLTFAWLLAAHTTLFLAFLSPASAIDFKHLSTLWPFAAFVPVLALSGVNRRARVSLAAVGGAALATAGAVAVTGYLPEPLPAEPPLERARAVLLDNVARGVLPRIVWRLPDETRVFAADQRRLLEDPCPWLGSLERGDLYVGGLPASDPRYGNSPERGRGLAAAVGARHRLVPLPDPLEPGHVFGLGDPLRAPGACPARRPESRAM